MSITVKRTGAVSLGAAAEVCARRTLEELLLQLGLCDLDLNSLVHLLDVAALVVRIVLDGGGEERVDEGGLSES